MKPKNWYSAHLHVGFDATKVHADGSKTQFMALDKCIPNRDYMRVKSKIEIMIYIFRLLKFLLQKNLGKNLHELNMTLNGFQF